MPAAVRAAAALVLGALARSRGMSAGVWRADGGSEWIKQAQAWAYRYGLSASLRTRRHLLDVVLDHLPVTRESKRIAPLLTPFIPQLLRWADDNARQHCLCGALAAGAVALAEAMPDVAEGWLEWLLGYLRANPPRGEHANDEQWLLRPALMLALQFAEGDLAHFGMVFSALLTHGRFTDVDRIERALPVLRRYPALSALLREALPQQPRRCLDLLERLAQVVEPGTEVAPLEALTLLLADGDLDYPPDWQSLLEVAADLAPVATSYLAAQRLLAASMRLPAGIARALALPARLAAERDYLEGQLATRPEVQPRLAGLRRRLADPEALRATVRAEVRERLRQAVPLAAVAAAEQVVRDCLRARMRRAVGPREGDLSHETEERLLSAIPFLDGLRANRRLLRRMLRAYAIGDHERLACHPANAAFLRQLAARGIDLAAWLGEHRRRVPCAAAPGGWVSMALERDPLLILQMGAYFHTCLSAGAGNAHAAVANACELNKRVLYARDAAGQVIGRKLIGINEDGCLIGYRTYSTLTGESAAPLRAAVDSYCRGFAASCDLQLADGGTVPRLFAQDWYDDGAVPWEDTAAAT